jgi:protocatechuate 3,4-dioxygenase beta subunit
MRTSRRLLIAAGAGFLPLRAGWAASLAATPAQTEGPFYPTSFPADMDSDLVQVRGQAAQAMGTVLHLQGRVLDSTAVRSMARWSRSGRAMPRASTTIRASPGASGAIRPSRATAAFWRRATAPTPSVR